MTGARPAGQAEPRVAGMESAPGTRMAGMTMAGATMAGAGMEAEDPAGDDEGARALRMFLEERNRTVPQPPLLAPTRDRTMRKSL